eukprot:Selendium_serpulae@DN6411_c0_g1_i2.p1
MPAFTTSRRVPSLCVHDHCLVLMGHCHLLSGASFSEVLDECLESVRERNLRLPTEDRFRAADVGVPLLGVVLRQRSVFQFDVLCHRFSNKLGEFLDRELL